MERRTNKWVFDSIGSVLMLTKSMPEREMKLFGHIVRKKQCGEILMQGKIEGNRRRGRRDLQIHGSRI